MTETPADRRLRLFLAADVPAHVRRDVDMATVPLRAAAPNVHWTDPSSWHLTLSFLGAVHPARVPDITEAVSEVTASAAPFALALDGKAGMFGQRVLWVGFERSQALEQLAEALQQALDALGFPGEGRPFHPHLTLARSKADGRLPRGIADTYDGPRASWDVTEVVLLRSELHRHGAHYSTQGRFALGG